MRHATARRLMSIFLAILVSLIVVRAPGAATQRRSFDLTDPLLFRGLEWRSIGPYRGGRVVAVAGVPGQSNVYYFGGTGSGIWKSSDAGATWRNVSDGQFGSSSVGAIAVAPSDPNVIYAGMGEGCIRGNLSQGDGIYRSVDAGRSWKHLGLAGARQIGRVRIDPHDPDRVYVAALGHAFQPNRERGVFRSIDGGVTWKNVLFVNDSTGAIDLALDPENPRILYATTWQVMRTPWSLESGGAGSGLWKSTDGGDHWRRLQGGGLPRGIWGRAGVAVSPVNPDRVWAAIEAADGGVFRSDDAGRTWTRTNQDHELRQRAWYYTHVYADPANADRVYVLNVRMMVSSDGGRTFATLAPPHTDNHDLWIDPGQPQRMIESNDGGVNVSLDGGATWTRQDNQPTGQFYHVIADDQFPYRLYGAQQDNSSVSIASRTRDSGILANDWYDAGGCESGYLAPKPGAPGVNYAGCYIGFVGRYDHRTGEERNVSPYPENPLGAGAESIRYRFQWTFPIVVSRFDPNTVYACGNCVFKSTNEGQSWKVISPDLTRNDPAKLGPSGGPITKDNTSVEYYCTLFAFAESPLDSAVLWTGSDDGRVHVTRDGGAHWTEITPHDLPPWSTISQIDASPFEPGTAFLAANRYKMGDERPYAYVTHDYGRSWRSIARGIPAGAFVRAVRQDPRRAQLLFCATELGVYASTDGGAGWFPLKMAAPGSTEIYAAAARQALAAAAPESAAIAVEEEPRGALPIVPVTDLIVKDDDLAIATQGRGFWILDGIDVLRELTPAVAGEEAHLFTPSPAYLFGGPAGRPGTGRNPPRGVLVDYLLARDARDDHPVTLEILDAAGKPIRSFTSRPDTTGAADGAPPPPRVPARRGINRFVWDFRTPPAGRFKGMILWGGTLEGPEVLPGRYRVRLTCGNVTQTRDFEVRKDPRTEASPEALARRFDFLTRIRNHLDATHAAIRTLRDVREQVKSVAEKSKPLAPDSTLATQARSLVKRLTEIEETLYQTKLQSSQDPLNYPIRLNNKLADLSDVVGADAEPTDQAEAIYRDLATKIDAELTKLDALLGTDLPEFNRKVRELEIPAVVVKPGARPTAPTP